MFFPPLQPVSTVQSCVSGDVSIDPSASIASGVLLKPIQSVGSSFRRGFVLGWVLFCTRMGAILSWKRAQF
uniref:Uncharacterized protein n=1 Tax=Desertifilum tharense IPPAS B-1220 TaxID=1781255 RepID=A0ACD5GUN1_9CYAN